MIYRRRASPLHAARAAVGCGYCAGLAMTGFISENPVVLAGALLAILGAGLLAGVGGEMRRAAIVTLPVVFFIAAVNPFVVREGLTVIARLGDIPVLGALDITLEACAYGGVLALRASVVIMAFALYASAIDPDEVLRLFRRVSFRSALTATVATRLLPVLARDARRMADAQRCRPGATAPRLVLFRAVTSNALERAIDVAATLEVRGYGSARRPPPHRRAWSRHDLGFAAAAGAVTVLAVGSRLAGVGDFDAYPELVVPAGAGEIALGGITVICALFPFLDRRGVGR